MTNQHVCSFCRNPKAPSAEWLLSVSGTERRVHKPCGVNALALAPKGVQAKVVPSRELVAKWKAEKAAKAFWGEKFSQAEVKKEARQNSPPLVPFPLAAE